MLEINISALDMLKVLVNAGIEATEAKAIIFDLLQYPEREAAQPKPLEARVEKAEAKRGRPRKVKEAEGSSSEETSKLDDIEFIGQDDDVATDVDRDTVILKKPSKRITFKEFGGLAKPITPA